MMPLGMILSGRGRSGPSVEFVENIFELTLERRILNSDFLPSGSAARPLLGFLAYRVNRG
jgi:hypothetical protein